MKSCALIFRSTSAVNDPPPWKNVRTKRIKGGEGVDGEESVKKVDHPCYRLMLRRAHAAWISHIYIY
jgi:hypothetical protein